MRAITMVKRVGLCVALAAMFAFVQPAGSAVIYGFTGLTTGSALAGQDGWTSLGGNTGNTKVATGAGWAVGNYLSSGSITTWNAWGKQYRMNDGTWSYSIPAAATGLILEFDAQGGWTGSSSRSQNLWGLGVDGAWSLRFGGRAPTSGSGLFYGINNTAGAGYAGAASHFTLDVDLTANGGTGSAIMYVDTGGGDVQKVSVADLGLTPGEWANWNSMYIEQNRYCKMDTLTLTIIPEPATLSLVAMGALGMIARRKRK